VKLARRDIVLLGVRIVSAFALIPLFVTESNAADTCTDPASEGLRSSLHYTNAAPDPKQACNGCAFFSEENAKQGCGNCMIMSGPVNKNGHCDSWAMKG
jgi:hypothetical protein